MGGRKPHKVRLERQERLIASWWTARWFRSLRLETHPTTTS